MKITAHKTDVPEFEKLFTVKNLEKELGSAGQTQAAIRWNVFTAEDRMNSRGGQAP